MDIKELKSLIENRTITNEFLIMKYSDNYFIPNQYLKEISNILNKEINIIEEFNPSTSFDIFGGESTEINVFYTDKFEYKTKSKLTDYIVVCKSIDKTTESIYSNNVVVIPKLEDWQILDYAQTNLSGVSKQYTEYLVNSCNKDMFLLEKEVDKLSIFDKQNQEVLFKEFVQTGVFNSSNKDIIFQFTNSIIQRNREKAFSLYKTIKETNADVEPMGVLSLLYSGFKNVIKIQLSKNPTAESCKMKSNQFWAIKNNNIGFYTKEELINIFLLLTNIDKQIRTGYINTDKIVEYIMVNVL